MWPLLLDSSEEECMKTLRRLELEAYGSLVSALRAQGGLTSEKLKILKDTASILHITPERHRAEIRRAVNDEQLCTIAQYADGSDTYAEWSVEGRRKVRLVPRLVPQTAFLAVARRVADVAQADNAKMPWPAATARPPIAKPPQPPPQVKYESDERASPVKKRRRLSQDSLPPPSYVPATAKHRLQKHGISKIQQMYKSQSRTTTVSVRSQSSPQQPQSTVQESTIMPPPRATIKTIPPVKQRIEVPKPPAVLIPASSVSPITTGSPTTVSETSPLDKNSMTVAKVVQPSGGTPVNKSLIKISQNQQTPHQKLVIVSASQPINSNILHQSSTNKILTPINTLKIKSSSADDLLSSGELKNSKVIVSKSQLTPLQPLGTGEKPKLLTVQAKVRPQGSIIVPLQGQNSTVSGQFAGVSVPVLQGVQWKAIQGKSTVKLLPLSGNAKIIQKQGGAVGSTPIYVMSKSSNIVVNKNSLVTSNSETNSSETTKTISNITHIRPLMQKTTDDITSGKVLVVRKAAPTTAQTGTTTAITSSVITPITSPSNNNATTVAQNSETKEDTVEEDGDKSEERKSTVLQDALRASGVTSIDDDIESQISQYTVISKNKLWQNEEMAPPVTKSLQNIQLQDTKYLTLEEAVAILGDNSETRALLSHLQVEPAPTDGQLDPQTGIYSPISIAGKTTATSLTTSTEVVPAGVAKTNNNNNNTTNSEERLDIFSTALASADIQLDETNEYFETSESIEQSNEIVNTPDNGDKQLVDILTSTGETNR